MSDPQRFVPPPSMSREQAEELVEKGRALQDRCPGALIVDEHNRGHRSACGAQVVTWRRGGMIYRAGLCAACSGREMREREDARARHASQPQPRTSRRMNVGE